MKGYFFFLIMQFLCLSASNCTFWVKNIKIVDRIKKGRELTLYCKNKKGSSLQTASLFVRRFKEFGYFLNLFLAKPTPISPEPKRRSVAGSGTSPLPPPCVISPKNS